MTRMKRMLLAATRQEWSSMFACTRYGLLNDLISTSFGVASFLIYCFIQYTCGSNAIVVPLFRFCSMAKGTRLEQGVLPRDPFWRLTAMVFRSPMFKLTGRS
jgi:hypothetical protein